MSATHDAPCSGCALDRRTFLSQSTLVAVAALLTDACGTGVWDPQVPATPLAPTAGLSLRVTDYPALSVVGGIVQITDPAAGPLAIVRIGATSFVALSLRCPHQGTTVNVSGAGFVCPNHGARFSTTGTWTGGQATANLTSYPMTYNAVTGTLSMPATTTTAPATPVANGTKLLVTLATVPALAVVGGIARVDGNSSSPIALVRSSETTYVALSMRCPHQGATVSIQSGGFTCPRHGARFSAVGTWLGGERTTSLRVLTSAFDAAAGSVTITIPAGNAAGDDVIGNH